MDSRLIFLHHLSRVINPARTQEAKSAAGWMWPFRPVPAPQGVERGIWSPIYGKGELIDATLPRKFVWMS